MYNSPCLVWSRLNYYETSSSPRPIRFPLNNSQCGAYLELTKSDVYSINSYHYSSTLRYITQRQYHSTSGPVPDLSTNFHSYILLTGQGWLVHIPRHHSTFNTTHFKRPQRSTLSSSYTQVSYHTNLSRYDYLVPITYPT
jgi:hypothetical protein